VSKLIITAIIICVAVHKATRQAAIPVFVEEKLAQHNQRLARVHHSKHLQCVRTRG
jgi:hypothetical protein